MRVVLVVDPVGDAGEFVREIADAATSGLRRGGHDVDVIDLVARRYSPVMPAAARRAYFSGAPLTCAETTEDAERVRQAQGLVFVYPSTLSTVTPAIKGWIDRTFVPGVAFTIGDATAPKRGLSNVRRIMGIVTYDDSRRTVQRQGDNGRRLIRRNVRLCGGLRTRSSWLGIYGVDLADEHGRARVLGQVEQRMARK